MSNTTKEENPAQTSTVTQLKDSTWEPVEWPTLNENQKKLEEKTLVGTARTILDQKDIDKP